MEGKKPETSRGSSRGRGQAGTRRGDQSRREINRAARIGRPGNPFSENKPLDEDDQASERGAQNEGSNIVGDWFPRDLSMEVSNERYRQHDRNMETLKLEFKKLDEKRKNLPGASLSRPSNPAEPVEGITNLNYYDTVEATEFATSQHFRAYVAPTPAVDPWVATNVPSLQGIAQGTVDDTNDSDEEPLSEVETLITEDQATEDRPPITGNEAFPDETGDNASELSYPSPPTPPNNWAEEPPSTNWLSKEERQSIKKFEKQQSRATPSRNAPATGVQPVWELTPGASSSRPNRANSNRGYEEFRDLRLPEGAGNNSTSTTNAWVVTDISHHQGTTQETVVN